MLVHYSHTSSVTSMIRPLPTHPVVAEVHQSGARSEAFRIPYYVLEMVVQITLDNHFHNCRALPGDV